MNPRRAIPSMFHRRLVLLSGVMLFVTAVLGVQLARLAVVQGAERLERAERSLEQRSILPTYRGTIRDRQGRELAVDRPGYALAVAYDVITGAWEETQARREARRESGRSRWLTMTETEQDLAVARVRPAWAARRERLWQAIQEYGGIDRRELDERLESIREDVEDLARHVWERQEAAARRRYGIDEDDAIDFRRRPIREQEEAHVVLPSISDETAFAFWSLANELPEGMFEVQDARRRAYPWLTATVPIDRRSLPGPLATDTPISVRVDGVADHILGAMRDVRAEDVERRPFRRADDVDLGGYQRVGDRAGAWGIERVFEDHLRGRRGEVHRRLDTDEEVRTDPVPGRDLTLTVDIALQARIQALMSDEIGLTTVQPFHHNALPNGWPLNGAAVVVEIESGEVLALVSMPTRAMGLRTRELDPQREAIDDPWVNRPVEGVYPPGSIVKPLVLAAAVTEGVHQLDRPIECTGQYFPNGTGLRCWIYRERWNFQTHGELLAEDAIAQSCNIFFYTLADRLGLEAITTWYRRLGVGHPLDAGLEWIGQDEDGEEVLRGENGGFLLSDEQIAAMDAGTRRSTAIMMGIGQGGGITWTPLHAANAYATLARGGVIRDATLIMDDPRPVRPRQGDDLRLDPAAVEAALEGLRRAVSPGGTGYAFPVVEGGDRVPIINAEGVTVWGKTGTAQAPPLRFLDTNGDGTIDGKDEGIGGLDHAWFVGLVGPDDTRRPMFAITVIIEYGGSGGRVAGPIANQIIRALQVEGYLPAGPLSLSRRDG